MNFARLTRPHATPPHNVTMCTNCTQFVHLDLAVVKVFHLSRHVTEQHFFCSEQCHHEWYIRRLNQLGM